MDYFSLKLLGWRYPKREWLATLFADQLKAYRELKGLTREQIAEEFSNILDKKEGIDARTILRWESGKQVPHLQTYLKLKHLFVDLEIDIRISLETFLDEAYFRYQMAQSSTLWRGLLDTLH